MRWSFDPGPAVRAAWFQKNCGPTKARRVFDPGGPESGTLAEARRAPGLFDENWDREFPLTARERADLETGQLTFDPQTGELVRRDIRDGQLLETRTDPFFAPPTTPAPANWIEEKIKRLRGTFGPTQYFTPKGLSRFCPEGGFGITCAGPDGEVGWTGGTVPLTPLDVARFREAYCAPGQCQTGGKVTPPAGYKEFVIKVKPRNPAVALKASCQPVLAAAPVVMDVPLPAPGAPVPAVTDWSCEATERGCLGTNCVVDGKDRIAHWKAGTPWPVLQAWFAANCGGGG